MNYIEGVHLYTYGINFWSAVIKTNTALATTMDINMWCTCVACSFTLFPSLVSFLFHSPTPPCKCWMMIVFQTPSHDLPSWIQKKTGMSHGLPSASSIKIMQPQYPSSRRRPWENSSFFWQIYRPDGDPAQILRTFPYFSGTAISSKVQVVWKLNNCDPSAIFCKTHRQQSTYSGSFSIWSFFENWPCLSVQKTSVSFPRQISDILYLSPVKIPSLPWDLQTNVYTTVKTTSVYSVFPVGMPGFPPTFRNLLTVIFNYFNFASPTSAVVLRTLLYIPEHGARVRVRNGCFPSWN